MEGDFIKKDCCGEIFGHKRHCRNYKIWNAAREGRDFRDECLEIITFLTSLDKNCKTTLDIGIRVKDYVKSNKTRFNNLKKRLTGPS